MASTIEAQACVELAVAKLALDATQTAVNCLNKASLAELKIHGQTPRRRGQTHGRRVDDD
jgi:hypothetical protein